MNDETQTLLFGVADRLEQAIRERDLPAVVALQGDRVQVLTDYDYLHDDATAAAFESRAAGKAREIHAVRFVFAVPQVWLATEEGVSGRAASNHPLRDGEQEVVAWMSYDTTDGVDYGHVPYVRQPTGEPVFDDLEIFTAPAQPYDHFPGRLLLRSLLDD